LRAKWQSEKAIIEKIQFQKQAIESLKIEADEAERRGDYGKVAELRYGRIKEAEQNIDFLKDELAKSQSDFSLIKEEVDSSDIAEVVARWTGIPVSRMLQSEREKLLVLEDHLHKRVVGQHEAIVAVSDAVRRSRAGLQDVKRPIGSFIFLGTTGVGKTELAKALAEFLFNNEDLITRIDMSEYQERHSVSRLVGAPPGYVGYEEGGQLTEVVRHKPYSVVLLDEIEKAHPDVFNILLQVLEDGRLTDNKGRLVDFKNTIIIMTSNIGSQIIQANLGDAVNGITHKVLEKTRDQVFELLRITIRPEFLNRVDDIIMFSPLTKDEIHEIVNIQLHTIRKMLEEQGIIISITESAIDWIVRSGFDPLYGARPIKRLIQRYILNQLSKEILAGKISKEKLILIDYTDGSELVFR
jgi:ATP-dependent Clp protease ATP-binding subunit ClpB